MSEKRPDETQTEFAIRLVREEERKCVLQSIAKNLVKRYLADPVATAYLCDDEIDRSGNLLGYVRDAVRGEF